MNKDQVKGRIERAKGSIKEVTGKAVGSERLEAEGKLEKAVGKVQSAFGDAKNRAKSGARKS